MAGVNDSFFAKKNTAQLKKNRNKFLLVPVKNGSNCEGMFVWSALQKVKKLTLMINNECLREE
jgi:hypothetical protein